MSDLYLEPVEEEEQDIETETTLSAIGFSEDDRSEILAEIDDLVSENKIPITGELFKISPRKKGFLLPLLINIIAIGIVAGVFLFFRGTFISNQEAENESIINYYTGGAGEILERLRAESEAELAAKNAEIENIQIKLSELDKQSRALKGNIDSIVEQEKQRLEEQMQAYLAEERARLQAEGNSAAEIEEKLKRTEQTAEQNLEQMLAEARAEAEEQIKQRETALENERKLIASQLQNAENERENLEADFQKELEERQAAFDAEREALASEASEASRALERLNAQRQQEKAITDQIDGSMSIIIDSMKNSEFEAALTEIDNLEALYKNPKTITLPAVAGRMKNDLFTLGTFREQIKMKTSVEEIDTSNLAEAATVLVTTTEYAEQGIKAYSEGNTGEARTTLKQAVEKVPELYEAFETLQKIETVHKTDISKTHIKTGTEYYDQNALTKAVESFQDAAYIVAENNREEMEDAIKGMSRVYEKLYQQKLYNKDEEIKKLISTSSSKDGEINKLKVKIADQQEVYQKLNEDYTALLEQKTAVASDTETTGEQNTALQASLNEARNEINSLRSEYETLQAENEQASADLQEANAALEQLQEEYSTASASLAETEAANLELNTALTSNQEILGQTRLELETLSRRNSELENELVQAKASFSGSREEHDAAASAISKIQEENTRLKEENTRLNENLTLNENSMAALNLEIEEYKKNIEELQASIDSARGEMDSAENTTASLENELSAAGTEYEQQLKDLAALHEQQTAGLKEKVEELESANSFLTMQNAELDRKHQESAERLDSTLEVVNRLREENAVLETDLENAIDDSEKNLRQLKKESEKAIEEKDKFVNSLISAYINYADKIEAKLAQNTETSINDANHLLGSFLSNENINALFPGFTSMIENLQKSNMDLERETIEARSRDDAFNDVLVASRYFSGSAGPNTNSYMQTITTLSDSESKYREIVEDFQSIALHSELSRLTGKSKIILLGSIVSVSNTEIIIEPLINDLSLIKTGDIINIRRKDRYGRETEITQARITSVRSRRITGSFIDGDIASRPLTADLAYKIEE